jgi:dihydroxy-acid dehydratase
VGHISPEAAEGGAIALIEPGDIVDIDSPARKISVRLDAATLSARRNRMETRGEDAWKPLQRERHVSQALKAYAAMATSAARGAVRDVAKLGGRAQSGL